MKKIIYLVLIGILAWGASSCKRSEVNDPEWNSPAGFYVLVEGSANPAVLFIDGNIHTSRIYVRVTDWKGTPLAGETIFFEQLEDVTSHAPIRWGYFENNAVTMKKKTNANGEVSATFYSGVNYYSGHIYIHALMEVNGHAYRGSDSHIGNVPQDFISIAMYKTGSGGTADLTK